MGSIDQATLTESGRVTIPSALRKAMDLKTGDKLVFVPVSDREFRVMVVPANPTPGPIAMLGYGRKFKGCPRRTDKWMREIRGRRA